MWIFISFTFLGFANAYAFQPSGYSFSWDSLSPQYSVKHFTAENGLPVNSVRDLLIHPDGFIYIATFDGLARFDGHQFKIYNTANTPGLKRNRIAQMLPAFGGGIWILDTSNNLILFKDEKVISYKNGFLPENKMVYYIHIDENDVLKLFTNYGLFESSNDESFIQKDSVSYHNPSIIKAGNRYNVAGNISPFENGLIIDGKEIIAPNDSSVSVHTDLEGNYWVKTTSDGIYQVRTKKMITVGDEQYPGLTNVYGIYEDGAQSLWVNSFEHGIFKISEPEISVWNQENKTLPKIATRTILNRKNGDIFAGGTGGLLKLDNGRWVQPEVFRSGPIGIDVLYEDSHKRLWIGSIQGLFLMKDGKPIRFIDSSGVTINQTKSMYEFFNKGLLFATSAQGIAFLDSTNKFHFITSKNGLSSNLIRDIYIASKDTVWAVSEDQGLNRIVLDENFEPIEVKKISEKDGLIDNSLHRMIKDRFGYFWINSNSGIMRINETELNNYADGTLSTLNVLGFTSTNDLENNEGNGGVQSAGLLTFDGKLIFPNQAGLIYTRPEWHIDLKLSQILSKPTVENIQFSDSMESIAGLESIALPKTVRDFQLKFTLPTFTYPDELVLEYKLDGVNRDWQKAGIERYAIFTNVPKGTHTFLMRGKLPGQSKYSESSFLIKIPSLFHETIWFYLLLIILGFWIITGFFKYRVRALKKREKILQSRVDEQTIELRKAAEQKQQFFTGITHELKTPLSLIISPLNDIIERKNVRDDQQLSSRLLIMQRNGQRLQHLINQILDVSKLNADSICLTMQPASLVEITRQIVGQFQSLLQEEKIDLKFEVILIEEQIYIDTEAWERIIINLLSNAIKFSSRKSSIVITFSDERKNIKVKIKDEGSGIPSNEREKIFQYLYQVEGTRAAEGTGIGLFLVKGLVEHMGGSIELNSELEKGSEFIITLKKGYEHIDDSHIIHHDPLIAVNDINRRPRINEPKSILSTQAKLTEQILLVEDNRDFRNYLKSVLQEHYKVITASEGNEALKILEKKSPELIISDVMMPGMNGLEFVGLLRKKNHFRHLPVIFLSAKDQEIDMEKGLSTGADIYLTKPIRSNLLLSQISAVLRRERVLKDNDFEASEKEEPELMKQVREIVYRQLANPSLSVNQLADTLYISRAKLYGDWKKVSEISVNDFIKKTRLFEAKILLKERGFNVHETACAVGYSDANYFSTSFKKEFGVNPSEV